MIIPRSLPCQSVGLAARVTALSLRLGHTPALNPRLPMQCPAVTSVTPAFQGRCRAAPRDRWPSVLVSGRLSRWFTRLAPGTGFEPRPDIPDHDHGQGDGCQPLGCVVSRLDRKKARPGRDDQQGTPKFRRCPSPNTTSSPRALGAAAGLRDQGQSRIHSPDPDEHPGQHVEEQGHHRPAGQEFTRRTISDESMPRL